MGLLMSAKREIEDGGEGGQKRKETSHLIPISPYSVLHNLRNHDNT